MTNTTEAEYNTLIEAANEAGCAGIGEWRKPGSTWVVRVGEIIAGWPVSEAHDEKILVAKANGDWQIVTTGRRHNAYSNLFEVAEVAEWDDSDAAEIGW